MMRILLSLLVLVSSLATMAQTASLTTTAVTGIGVAAATSGGTLTISKTGVTVTARGVCWATKTLPTVADNKTNDGTTDGIYSSSLTGLISGAKYYVRAYALSNLGVTYGNEVSFTTTSLVQPSTLTTLAISSITTSSANSGGNITNDGLGVITARGVCWGTAQNPTIALATKTSNGTGTGSFSSTMTDLAPGTTYFVRAYATNGAGTSYGAQVTFATPSPGIVLTTTAVSAIFPTSATSGGNITNGGSSAITARGVCWSTSPGPTAALATRTVNGTGTGAFTSSITGLVTNTKYYVRAYANNSTGTAYGNEVSFTTSVAIPELASPGSAVATLNSITPTTAIVGGNVLREGGAPVTARGICWGTVTAPTVSLSTKSSNGTGTGVFSANLTALAQLTKYYFRAYATNSGGTAYGTEGSFTTTTGSLPTLTTVQPTPLSGGSAASGGNITNEGSSAVTSRGVCWNTTPQPTVAHSKTTAGTGGGTYQANLTSVGSGSYYVRAFAVNGSGTVYGPEMIYTAPVRPIVTTAALTGLVATSAGARATAGGNVLNINSGNGATRGVVWSTTPGPTLPQPSTNMASTPGSEGAYTVVFAGAENTTYYLRAFATDSRGTGYGEEITFTTPPFRPLVTMGAVTAITTSGATVSATVTSAGAATLTERGFCYSTSPAPIYHPTENFERTYDGNTIGAYSTTLTRLKHGTTYYVRPYAYNNGARENMAYGTETSFTTALLPISTTPGSAITTTAAVSGGKINTSTGGAVAARGICWSTLPDPTIALATKTVNGSGMGTFVSNMTGLTELTLYYVRSYATTGSGTVYGDQLTIATTGAPVVDVDGNSYNVLRIGKDVWMTENLRTTKYRNGELIARDLSPGSWASTTAGACAVYDETAANATKYGRLYNDYAVTDRRGVCPTGWHVSESREWASLEFFVGGDLGYQVAGARLKSTGTAEEHTGSWNAPNLGATNEFGFNAIPGGERSTQGVFTGIGAKASFWADFANFIEPLGYTMEAPRTILWPTHLPGDEKLGRSIRCVRNPVP